MSKKKLFIILGVLVAVIALAIYLSKSGAIGNRDEGTDVETAIVDEITIIETVSATGKIQP